MGLRLASGVGHNSLNVMLPIEPYQACTGRYWASLIRRLMITSPAQAGWYESDFRDFVLPILRSSQRLPFWVSKGAGVECQGSTWDTSASYSYILFVYKKVLSMGRAIFPF